MASAFDAQSSATAQNVSSISWTHTPVGTPTAVAVIDYIFADPATSATYGGTSMGAAVQTQNDTVNNTDLFGLANPSSGAQTVVVNLSNAFQSVVCGAITATGSDTTTCFSASAKATGAASPITCTVASSTSEFVVGGGGEDPGSAATFTYNTGTKRWETTAGGSRGFGLTVAGAASVSPSVATTLGNNWGIVAGSIKAGASGSVITSAGASTVTNKSASTVAVPVSSTGVSTVTPVGASAVAVPVSSAGASTVTPVGSSTTAVPLTSAGVSTTNLGSQSQASAAIATAGVSTVNLVGSSQTAGLASVSIAGSAAVNLEGTSLVPSAISIAGASSVRLVGKVKGSGVNVTLWGKKPGWKKQLEDDDEELLKIVSQIAPELIRKARARR